MIIPLYNIPIFANYQITKKSNKYTPKRKSKQIKGLLDFFPQ